MLDIKFIREHTNLVKKGAEKKHVDIDISKLISIDNDRLSVLELVEELRTKTNLVSKRIPEMTDEDEKAVLISAMREHKKELQFQENKLRGLESQWRDMMLKVPNIPDMTVPDGKTDEDNQEIRAWGEKPEFSFEPKNHLELSNNLNLADFERGAKVHGFRGYFLMGAGARLSFALWQYAMDFFGKSENGFVPVIAPAIARAENFYGTGHLPNEAEDIFKTQDDDYLAGTSEVSVMGMHGGEVIENLNDPKKYLGFSSCYRREAGSYSKDTKGLIRVHEFYKVEQVILCEASHELSVELHEWITKNSEEFMQSLGIPHRVVLNCGGDLGLGQVKKYDIEAWVPSQNKYRETHSSSYFHDFQTRRFNIRYRDVDGKPKYAHSLNNTAVATPRILVPLLENNQNEDGSINVPEVLRPYMGGMEVIK